MSRLSNEIRALLQPVVSHADGSVTAEITFPAAFTGFQGHFPGRPLLPGVCQILCVLALAERVIQKKVRLRKVSLAKFTAPVACGQTIRLHAQLGAPDGPTGTIAAQLYAGSAKIAEIRTEVFYADTESACEPSE